MKPNGKFRKYISEHKSFLCFIINFICFLTILTIFWLSNTIEDYDKSLDFALIAFATDIILSLGIIVLGRSNQAAKGRKKGAGDIKPLIGNVTLDLMAKLAVPVLITDPKGYILWNNEAASECLRQEDNSGLLWKSISAVSGNQLSAEKFYETADSDKGQKNTATAKPDKIEKFEKFENQGNFPAVDIFINNKSFRVSMYKINSTSASEVNELTIFVFSDRTELEFLKYETEMKDPVAAYFMIDNLDETNQKMQDKYRNASGAVSDLLNEFIASYGGVIKEYSKDKYFCFFENRALKNFMKSKFGVLDLVRDIKIEELNMPVTISGGVSNITGSLFEKELAARHALDLALQRGGDQVVVKGSTDFLSFGGKTKTVQKRTKVRSRVTANELAELMKESSNILIMGHKFADNDSFGACVGIARFAMSLINRKVNIIVNIHDANIRSALAKLKNLEEYANIFIDESAALDKITGETLVVIADVNNPQNFESEAVYKNVYKCAIIDHHRKIIEYVREPELTYIEPSASSASELVAEILEQSLAPGELSKEEAELLLAGIILDTASFSRNTGARTFSAAGYLWSEGANPSDAHSHFKTNVGEFTKEAQFGANITPYRNKIAISVLEEEASVHDKTAGAKAANRMLEIDGIEASFVIYRIEDTIYISARSLGKVNVQIILETFNGGGHFDSAGAQVRNSTLKDVLILLKKTIDEYFDVN